MREWFSEFRAEIGILNLQNTKTRLVQIAEKRVTCKVIEMGGAEQAKPGSVDFRSKAPEIDEHGCQNPTGSQKLVGCPQSGSRINQVVQDVVKSDDIEFVLAERMFGI